MDKSESVLILATTFAFIVSIIISIVGDKMAAIYLLLIAIFNVVWLIYRQQIRK